MEKEKKGMNTRPGKTQPVKLLPRRENISRPTLQHNKSNFTIKSNKTLLEPKSVTKKVAKRTQQTVLPSISKGPPKTQKDFSHTQHSVLPPISKGRQKTQPGLSLNRHTLLPAICTSPQKASHPHVIQQPEGIQRSDTSPKETSASKEEQKVNKTPPVETSAMSPEAVLRDSKHYLTEYELEEIKDYKEVWYVGKEANKTRYSKVTETNDIKSFNSGYDTEEGFYKAIISDHLAYRFEVLELIGTGYSGQVLKCMDHKTMELVAIKVIRSKDSVHQLGMAEVKMLEVLQELDKNNTANIVHMKEYFYFRNHLCITFELFRKDLYKALKDTYPRGFNEKEVRKYTIDVLKCLQFLKRKRMIHGDLKPDNILLYKKGGEKRTAVCDFGGSYFARDRDHPLIHTLYYMSPEMLLGKRCSPATDMWSLGCLLAELHLGHCLFRGCNYAEQFNCIMKVLGVPPPELVMEAPKRKNFFDCNGIPLKIKDIRRHRSTLIKQLNSKSVYFVNFIERCLQYDPTKRLTPEHALQHPWILMKETKPVTNAGKTRSDAPVPMSKKKPALLKREKMLPLQLQPITKTKAKKAGN
ncbi:dual specificity tyrosine-phosphorylation-regulated kinase 4-like [Trachinotus anak]|uniref:dual specificity tyrosine-phosphorylation-regulated kinase 4-like n=1 Tax=Trachinotus anak TaxID=443729 RepID=UPI0039F233B2